MCSSRSTDPALLCDASWPGTGTTFCTRWPCFSFRNAMTSPNCSITMAMTAVAVVGTGSTEFGTPGVGGSCPPATTGRPRSIRVPWGPGACRKARRARSSVRGGSGGAAGAAEHQSALGARVVSESPQGAQQRSGEQRGGVECRGEPLRGVDERMVGTGEGPGQCADLGLFLRGDVMKDHRVHASVRVRCDKFKHLDLMHRRHSPSPTSEASVKALWEAGL